jgi:hypothetical protein
MEDEVKNGQELIDDNNQISDTLRERQNNGNTPVESRRASRATLQQNSSGINQLI